MKPAQCISVFIVTCALFVCSSPITGRGETSLAIRSPGEVAEYLHDHQLDKRVHPVVWAGTLTLLGVFTTTTCNAAFSSAGVNVPAIAACYCTGYFGIGSLAYAAWGHVATIPPSRFKRYEGLDSTAWTANGFLNYIHLYPSSTELGRTLDQLQATYNGSERVLVMHHPCSTSGCYNVFYDNHHDFEGDLVHHLALEPRGEWHLPKRQKETGPERHKGAKFNTDPGIPFFSDYAFYDFTKSVEHQLGTASNAETLFKDFLRGTYHNAQDLRHAGYFCMNWSAQGAGVAGTKGVYWQSEKYHMEDPDALASEEATCRKFTDG